LVFWLAVAAAVLVLLLAATAAGTAAEPCRELPSRAWAPEERDLT